MEPRHYLAALLRRWPTLVVMVVLGVLGSGVLTVLTPPTYTSTTALLFSVPGGASPGEVRQDAQYVESAIISLIAVARSPAVLGPVITEAKLVITPTELAETLTIGVVEKTTILEISADAASPREAARIARLVSEQLQLAIAELSPGVAGPLDMLMATTVEPATEPRFQSSPDPRSNALLGVLIGLASGVLVALYRESVGAKINGLRDVGVLTDLPVWPIGKERRRILGRLPRFWTSHASDVALDRRSEDFRRLGLALDSMMQDTPVRSISMPESASRQTTQSVATGLADVMTRAGHDVEILAKAAAPAPMRDTYPDVIVLDDIRLSGEAPTAATTPGSGSSALAVVEPGKTGRRALESLLSREGPGGHSLVGVVVADQSPDPPTGIRALLRRLSDPAPSRPNPADAFQHGSGHPVVAQSTVITALAALFLAGMAYGLPLGANTAVIASLALTPVWIQAIARYHYASLVLGLAVLALGYGFLLADWSSVDHVIDPRIAAETSLRFLGAFGTVGLILWARGFLPISRIALAYGAGSLLTGLSQLPGSPNPWKFQLAFGVTFIVLGLVTAQRRTSVSVAALLSLGLVSVVLDFRSWFAFCFLAAGLLLWQARPRSVTSKPTSRLLSLMFLAALGVASYFGATYAIVGGYLGDELQERSVEQIQNSGSLIAGGRPEWSITWVLMQHNPAGFGVGVVPNSEDILGGKEGFATVNVVFQSDYVEFLFGGQFKLHSVVADFWSNFGAVGLLLALAVAGVLLAGFLSSLTRRQAGPLAVFLVVASMWNLAFQPIYSSLPSLALALGVVLWPRSEVSRTESTGLASSRSATTRPPAPPNEDSL